MVRVEGRLLARRKKQLKAAKERFGIDDVRFDEAIRRRLSVQEVVPESAEDVTFSAVESAGPSSHSPNKDQLTRAEHPRESPFTHSRVEFPLGKTPRPSKSVPGKNLGGNQLRRTAGEENVPYGGDNEPH